MNIFTARTDKRITTIKLSFKTKGQVENSEKEKKAHFEYVLFMVFSILSLDLGRLNDCG